ncbi:MAG: amino acid ABC transporter substrate-binding protein [Candidatus Bathyarchaeota archaeon]|nr:amino acid ABC transporter substrate-binding protein [Candidatus Bathyarchaeota archaeon]
MSEDKISRRKYLKYAGAAVGIGAIAAAGYGISQYYQAPTPTTTPTTTPTSTPTTGKKKVKIGGTKPLTGLESLPGRAEYNGNLLWAKVVNEAGGIKAGDGNTYEVELILYSDESKPENVPRLYEKLITEDKVDMLLGPVWGPLGMATVPIVEKYRKFEVYGTCSFNPKDYRDWKYIVHTITNGPYYMAAILDMVWERVVPKDPEAKNIAIIHGDDAFRGTVGTYGKEYAEELGFNVVSYDSYNTGTTDLTPLLSKAKAAQPAILLNPASYGDAIITVKNMRDIDFNIKLLWAGTGVVYPKYYETLGKYAEGSVTCTQWEKGMIYQQDYGPSHDEFIDLYQKDYGDIPDYVVATGYQQGLVIQRAMELCDDPLNSDAMRKVAGEMEMTTFYGKYKVDPVTGWQTGHKMGVVQWQNGQKEVVWPMDANPGELWYPLPPWSEM